MPIIEVNHVTKEYRLGQMKSLKQTALNTFSRLRGNPSAKQEPFKALDDVDFKVEEGEVLGIIGTNGAGKSTLLKLLARVSTPTKGTIKVQGSIAPLIEVGAGLHPELTGRENIFLNGSIMGLPRAVIKEKFDEIVEFAELEEFIDTPIKRYSSGMMIRLGFSIATSVDADILIIDEVLAVGDLAFQRKCFDRMENLIKKQGKTVLLVSHNIRQVERLCSRVVLMSHGHIQIDNNPHIACSAFYNLCDAKIHEEQKNSNSTNIIDSTGEISIESIAIHIPSKPEPVEQIEMHSPFSVKVTLITHAGLSDLDFVLGAHTADFVYLFSASSALIKNRLAIPEGKHTIAYHFYDMILSPGIYSLRLGIRDRRGSMIWYGENLLPFRVTLGKREISSVPQLGLCEIPFDWQIQTK